MQTITSDSVFLFHDVYAINLSITTKKSLATPQIILLKDWGFPIASYVK